MRKHVGVYIIIIILFLTTVISGAAAEIQDMMEAMLTGSQSEPVSIVIESPEYLQIAQYEGERVESLNRLMKHFSVCINMDEDVSRTVFSIDKEPFYTIYTYVGENNQTDYEQLPNDGQESDNGEPVTDQKDDIIEFLDSRFFHMNRLLDGLYPVFENAADIYTEYSSVSSANLNFSGYGRGVKRITIQLSPDKVRELFPESFSLLSADEYTSAFLNSLSFQGNQKIILLYDKEDHLIRVNYDGILGLSAEKLRKVSIVWKCFRDENCRKDAIVLKTPEVKGYDRDNITYERDYTVTDDENASVSWNMQIDRKQGQVKRKTQFSAAISLTAGTLSGEITYNIKQDSTDQTIGVSTEIVKENRSEYNGILEITNKKGKIVTSSIKTGIRLGAGESMKTPSVSTNTDLEYMPAGHDAGAELNDTQMDFTQVLVQKLLELPKEDLSFLSKDIPDEIWNTLIQYK